MMKDRDRTDMLTALAVGAVVGIGTALLVRARQEDETHEILRKLRPVRKRVEKGAKEFGRGARRKVQQAGDARDELLDAGRDLLDELRDGAREIIRDTRDELRKAAEESIEEAGRAARKAARSALR